VNGVNGTIWTGSASEASVDGIYLSNLKWRFNPYGLFTGRLSYRVEATPVSGFLESEVTVSLSNAVSISGLTASLPLNSFAKLIGVPGLAGTASIDFERLEIVDGMAVAADGTLQIANLVVPIVGRETLGGYKAEFFTQNNGISASIEDTDGVVDFAGSLQIKADRSFEFLGQLVAKPETSQSIRQKMTLLPPANDRGQHELRLEGIL